MMVRIEYEGGRTTLFDTLSFTEGSPFSGANMLTEFELEMREDPEKGLWLTANWHQVRDDWRADAPTDGIPAARRSRGWHSAGLCRNGAWQCAFGNVVGACAGSSLSEPTTLQSRTFLRLSFDGRIFSNRASLPSYFDSNQGMKGAIAVN